MTTSVAVLAVLDAHVEFWSKELVRTRRDFDLHDSARSKLAVVRNARAAVAELIDVYEELLNELREISDEAGQEPYNNPRANAALARVKGA